MKVVVKKVDAVKREMQFEIPKERVSQKLSEIYQDIGRVARIKGFRPGKAPRHLIEAEHGALAREETLKKLIPEVYEQGISQENIDPIDLPEIHDVEFKDGTIRFTAHVDIKPEIKIKQYKGIKVTRKDSKVTDEELTKTLEYFKTSQGKDKETAIDDNFAKSLGYPSLETFKQSLTRQMEMDKDRQNRMDVENQIVDFLLKETPFAVPQNMVKKQLEHHLKETKHRLKRQGMPDAEIQKREDEMRKELQKVAEKDVRVYLILETIAQTEGMTAAEGESLPAKVMAFLLKEADWQQ